MTFIYSSVCLRQLRVRGQPEPCSRNVLRFPALACTWQHKLECDVYYVQHLTMWFDIKIFFMTVLNVFKREGVGVENSGVVSLYDTRDVQRPQYLQK